MSEQRQIFREKSLEKLSSPERLDQLLRIVRPQSWIIAAALAAGMVLVILWSIFGRIPATATGTAILVRPKQVVAFQSPASGLISDINVAVNDVIEAGRVIATLHLPTLEKQLEQELAKLELFKAHRLEMSALERELAETEKSFLAEQRGLLEERIESVREAAERYKAKSDSWLAEQRVNVEIAQRLSKELGETLDDRVKAYETLSEEDLVSEDSLVEPRSRSIDNQLQLAELQVRAQELNLRENLAQESYDNELDRVKDLEIRISDLALREMLIERRLREDELTTTSERQEIRQRIAELDVQLRSEGRVISKHAGRVLEVTATLGQHVPVGQRLGKMEIDNPDSELMALAYFGIKDGKKIKPGLKIRVSPSTVERERHGGIVGHVTWVSDYPVTIDAAANEIGDLEVARSLLGGETRIEVMARLETDATSPTGFAWTSGKGPKDLPVTAGTTAEARVTTEELAPITLVLPFLESSFGM